MFAHATTINCSIHTYECQKNVYIYIQLHICIYIYTHPIPYLFHLNFICVYINKYTWQCRHMQWLFGLFVYIYIYVTFSFLFFHMCIYLSIYIFQLHTGPYLYHLKLHLCVCIVDTHDYVCTCNENKVPHSSIATNFRWPFNRPFVTLGVLTLDIRFTSVDFFMHDHGHLSWIAGQHFMFC